MSLKSKQQEYSRKINIEEKSLKMTVDYNNISVSRGFLQKIYSELIDPSQYREILLLQLKSLIENDERIIKYKYSSL